MTKVCGPSFLVLSSVTKRKEQFIRVQSFCDDYCGTYKGVFLDLKVCSKHRSWKNAILPVLKNFWPTFSPFFEHDKNQWTFYKNSQASLTFFVQMTRSFLWDLSGREKQTFQKTAVFKMTKASAPFFLVSSSVPNIGEQFITVRKQIWQKLWKF